MASVSNANSSPRTPRTRKTTSPIPQPSSAATSPASGSVTRNGTAYFDVSVAVV